VLKVVRGVAIPAWLWLVVERASVSCRDLCYLPVMLGRDGINREMMMMMMMMMMMVMVVIEWNKENLIV
jgi:hypothetical protein